MDEWKERRRADSIEEQRAVYEGLALPERRAIALVLDAASADHQFQWSADLMLLWFKSFNQSLVLAAWDVLLSARKLKETLAKSNEWGNQEKFYGGALRIALFCFRNNLIITYAAFDFLFVRLFGGDAKPLNPSLFLAAIAHPEIGFSAVDPKELDIAYHERETGWGPDKPLFWPKWEHSS